MKRYITLILLIICTSCLYGIEKINISKVDTSGTCYSAVLDTAVNPYSLGIAGNWRPQATYVYYSTRNEQNATTDINIRTAGTISSFIPFWKFQSGHLQADPDTTVWFWNQQSTIFNGKGFELENKDALERYNAGIYGYDNELPVAVIQNARYREVVFEGFEDYGYGMAAYDTVCPVSKGFDFLSYKSKFDNTIAHSGRYCLRIPATESISIGANVTANDVTDFSFNINRKTMACISGTGLQSIRANSQVIIPPFAPFPGKRMLVSAWVKEQSDCNCTSYTKSAIILRAGTTNVTCTPSGQIIDGWQHIEGSVLIPAAATFFTVEFQASSNTAVYFDDIRIHPFNANMQSYVYDPVTLRLMAQMDENNFASFYEYDDDGTLIRVKKETERGIKTIQETRSALIKDENP
ncbi:hypothetical protein SAMN05444266_103109 [Chitinophaga jiangningensis]|uniref:YD repeat-containing protein n=1 Tax=Chitinophaga jiangningensis TaxID=1419482 RepID=A0A1M7A3A6_9BACT|nr:hypothetical protein [Chitinophaga jiangningensis]SHL37232.1 hypothetical protein SAMN05444266_103109 [Chitinophaga jiangningensis]